MPTIEERATNTHELPLGADKLIKRPETQLLGFSGKRYDQCVNPRTDSTNVKSYFVKINFSRLPIIPNLLRWRPLSPP